MGRLRWLFLLSLMVACDGTTTGGEDSDALVSDGTADLGEVDLDATSSDAASTVDASLEPDSSAELDATPVPDAGQVERCGPLGRCTDSGGWCEPADHPECWRGEAPACFDEFHPLSRANCADMMSTGSPAACECPPGLESAPGEDVCVAVTSRLADRANETYRACPGPRSPRYGAGGAHYEDSDGDGTNDVVVDAFWGPTDETDRDSGRLNQVGVWACDWQVRDQSGLEPLNEWIGFSHCFGVDAPADFLIGVSGDDRVRLRVNGQLVFESPEGEAAQQRWFIRKVSLNSGVNFIEFSGLNVGNVGAVGMEISGPFESGTIDGEQAQRDADYRGRILFSSAELAGSDFTLGQSSGYTCPDEGQMLNTCRNPIRCSMRVVEPCIQPPIQCPDGQHAVDEACVDNECTCAFGVPALGVDCPEHGAALCAGCFQGYHLEDGACVENECECENGFTAHSAGCEVDGAQACLFCDDGYRLVNNRCEPNICECVGGVGARGVECPEHGAALCVECDAGLHVEDGICLPNICQCRHGEFDPGAPCPVNGGDACRQCDRGYHLEGVACVPNVCICDAGNGAVGPDCIVDGAVWCTGCIDDHRLEDGQCVANQCTCFNGTGVNGVGCPRDGALRCAECDPGYRLEGNVCVQSDCLCANGSPSIGDDCPGVGQVHCAECNPGFVLENDRCEAIVCPCAHGQAAVGVLCPMDGSDQCINCDPGFHLDGQVCVERVCLCENGTPRRGLDCPELGQQACAACDDGFRLVDGRCEAVPQPTCDDAQQNGAETGVDCGGDCEPCPAGEGCLRGADCLSGICQDNLCQIPRCGDGVTNGLEGCDDGNSVAEACRYGQQECVVCDESCQLNPGITSYCGDAIVDQENGEACDDGDLDDTDGCTSNCSIRCENGARDADEADVDCGGGLCEGCQLGENCRVGGDCLSGFCAAGVCSPAPRCDDGVQNGAEAGVDCGGDCAPCPACDDGVENGAEEGIDCGGPCAACPTCDDGLQNGAEEGIDCGGPCAACPTCDDGLQNGAEEGIDCGGPCAACPTCDDGLQNGAEEGIDCGGRCAACPTCDDGLQNGAEEGIDCGGRCAACPTCDDGLQNGAEEGIDCGGDCRRQCPSCDDGVQNGDERGVDCGGDCPACPTCDDGIQNGNEKGIDCGGNCAACPSCVDGLQNGAEEGVDCGGSCPACPSCDDGIQNGAEEGVDCGGECRLRCASCRDGVQNGDETGVDCGGACPACAVCGDGVVDGGEDCDAGDLPRRDCRYGEQACLVCGDDCQLIDGQTSFCGDGQVDRANGEECDDQNAINGDGCDNCRLPCFGCGCADEPCVNGAPVVVDTLNLNGLTFYPLHQDDCTPLAGNDMCCQTGTQESMDALCKLAGHCSALDWTVETLQSNTCYCWGQCTNCSWFPNCCAGDAERNFITSVTCASRAIR